MTTRTKTLRFAGLTASSNHAIGKCWTQIGGVWTDETTDINSSGTSDVTLGGTIGDEIYFGTPDIHANISFDTGTSPTGTLVAEYYNGSSWVSLSGPPSLPTDNTSGGWAPPTNWTATQVNGESDGPWYYWRYRRTVAGTGGILSGVNVGNVSRFLSNKSLEITDMASPRNIKSCVLRLTFCGCDTTQLERIRVYGRWDSTAYADLIAHWTTTNNFSHSGAFSHQVDIDITSITSTAWSSGNTHTIDGWIALCYRGVASDGRTLVSTGEIFITYDYDDTASSQMVSHVLPIDSLTAGLGITSTVIGASGDVPNLATDIIKETNASIKDLYFLFPFNMNEAGNTDYSFNVSMDLEGEVVLGSFDARQNDDFYCELIWPRTDLNINSSHTLKARVTNASGSVPQHLGSLMIVTYSFDVSASNRTMTLTLPMSVAAAGLNGTAATEKSVAYTDFYVEDISASMIRGGIQLYHHQQSDPGNLLVAIGSQSERSYSAAPGDTVGPLCTIQRFDPGAIAGSGFNLSRGKNTLQVSVRADTSPSVAGGCSAIAYVTYSYNKNQNYSTSSSLFITKAAINTTDWATANRSSASTVQFILPESNWYISHLGCTILDNASDAYSVSRIKVKKGDNMGWVSSEGVITYNDAAIGIRITNCCIDYYKKYTEQSSSSYEIDMVGSSHAVHLDTPNSRISTAVCWVVWHDHIYTISGNITGSAGGTVYIKLFDNTNKLLLETTRVGNGTFSFNWYDNTTTVYVTAYENSSFKGMSKEASPGSGFDISLSSGGGTKVFTF